jgi:hypothetical protein
MMREARRRYAEWCLLPEKSREKACTKDGVSGWLHKVQGKGAGWWHATGMWKKVKKGRRIRGQRRERERKRGEKRRELWGRLSRMWPGSWGTVLCKYLQQYSTVLL